MKYSINNILKVKNKYIEYYNKNSINMIVKDIKDIVKIYKSSSSKHQPIFDIESYIDTLNQDTIDMAIESIKSGYSDINQTKNKDYISSLDDYNIGLVLLTMLPVLNVLYKENNISNYIFYHTISDIFLRLNIYYLSHSDKTRFGLESFEGSWLIRIFYLNIFKIGSLQYEKVHNNWASFCDQTLINNLSKMDLNPPILDLKSRKCKNIGEVCHDVDLISIHIMQGENIKKLSCIESIKMAKEFFSESIYNYKCFYCRSWLLYRPMKSILSSKSNIGEFMDIFNIIYEYQDPSMALDRIFGKYTYSLKDIKNPTSLQIKARNNRDLLGIGIGILK